MMNETIKEKRVRYLLIAFFILITISAIFFRTNKLVIEPIAEDYILALVLQKSNSSKENPLIALYQKNMDNHILTYYEIERNNEFYFRAKHAATLRKAPTELANDRSGVGVWAKIDHQWYYFNQSLQQTNNNRKKMNKTSGQSIAFQQKRDDDFVRLFFETSNQKKMGLQLTSEKDPKELFALTNDHSLWLILFEDEVKIATTQAK